MEAGGRRPRTREGFMASQPVASPAILAAAPMTTMLPVRDLDRARTFYAVTLGLDAVGARPDGKYVFRCGNGALLALFPRDDAVQARYTAASFAVDDIRAAIAELESRGVKFNDYDLPGFRTVGHVCVLGGEQAAWFDDPDGNILCIHQDAR